jgi:hypothetical protein
MTMVLARHLDAWVLETARDLVLMYALGVGWLLVAHRWLNSSSNSWLLLMS